MAAANSVYVREETLARIVNGPYDTKLSEAEAVRIESVPENLRPWFRAVVEKFYLPLRGIVKSFAKNSPDATGTDFLDMLVEQLTQEGTIQEETVRASYSRKQHYTGGSSVWKKSKSVPFEEAADKAMAKYLAAIRTQVENSKTCNSNFRFIGLGMLKLSLREKILG